MSNSSIHQLPKQIEVRSNSIAQYENAREYVKHNPAWRYLSGLNSPRSKRTMLHALRTVIQAYAKVVRRELIELESIQPLQLPEIDDVEEEIQVIYKLITDAEDAVKRDPSLVYQVFVFPWQKLTAADTEEIFNELRASYSYSSVNRSIAALRQVLKKAWKFNLMKTDDYMRAVDLERATGESTPSGRFIKDQEIKRLLEDCRDDNNQNIGFRDRAIISLLATAGLRRAECVGLMMQDIDFDNNEIKVVAGKGNKDRIVPVENLDTLAVLKKWISIRGAEPGALFVSVRKGGKVSREIVEHRRGRKTFSGLRGITAQSVYDMLKRRANRTNVKDIGPHDLRRTFISNSIATNGLADTQKLAGHADPVTTSIYDRRGMKALHEAAKAIEIPSLEDDNLYQSA